MNWFRKKIAAPAVTEAAPAPIPEVLPGSEDDRRVAALTLLTRAGMDTYPCRDSFYGGSPAECDRAQVKLDGLRARFSNVQPRWLQHEIDGWFEYVQGKIDNAREDLRTREHEKHMAEYHAECDRQARAVKDLLADTSVSPPTPPHP